MHFLFFSLRIKNDIHNKHKIQDKINNVRTQALLEYNATAATLISNFLEIWLKMQKVPWNHSTKCPDINLYIWK